MYFSPNVIGEIFQTALSQRLADKRSTLMSSLPIAFVAGFETNGVPSDQLFLDLNRLNTEKLVLRGAVPFETWLRTGAILCFAPDPKHKFEDWADAVREIETGRGAELAVDPDISAAQADLTEEAIIFESDFQPFQFLHQGQVVGESVVQLTVPRQDYRGQDVVSNGIEAKNFGTGWFIGKRHILTCHHVIAVRELGEAEPTHDILESQAEAMTARLDYDGTTLHGETITGFKLIHSNASLDYAVLSAPNGVERPALQLEPERLALPPNRRMPVNIIQHPVGEPKQICTRNNLGHRLYDRTLSYFTDTVGGSSGAPVCNDDWRVLALHRGTQNARQTLNYLGKKTAYINIGVRIDKIREDLQQNHSDIWQAIQG